MFDESAPSEPEPDTVSVPTEIVVIPVYVLAPDNDNVPVPVPPLVNPNEPEMIPDIVPVDPDPTCTDEFAAITTGPDNVPAEVNHTAPTDEAPSPEIVNGSAYDTVPATSSVAPSATVVPCPANEEPSALGTVIFNLPADTSVVPV